MCVYRNSGEDNGNDNCIEFLRNEKRAYVTFSQPKFKNRVLRLAEECPDDVQIINENDGGMLYATVPVDWVQIRKPRTITDEQREKMRDQLNKLREEGQML